MQDLEYLKEKVRLLPYCPGIYIMKDRNGVVIYVGKSKALRNRVGQYFLSQSGHSPKTAKMVSNVQDFEIIITKTEYEALVLECSLIKKYRPEYNILLKDGNGYSYIRFTLNEPFPSLSIVNQPTSDKATYFGPYLGKSAATNAIYALQEALKLPHCDKKFPRDIGKGRPCLNSHLNKCMAPCSGQVSEEQYKSACKEAILLLEGKQESLTKELQAEMEKASEELRFERAAALRDRIFAIKKITEKQNIISSAFADTDVIAFNCGDVKGCIVVLHYISGGLISKQTEILGEVSKNDFAEILTQFITQYYSDHKRIPAEVLLSHDIDDMEMVGNWLGEICGHKVTVHSPKRGAKRCLTELALKNALDEAVRSETTEQRDSKLLTLLAELLSLEQIPKRIEAFDISNMAGQNVVAGMIVLENGRLKRSEYRKFNIKYVDGQNDTACMAETIRRRFNDMLENKAGFDKRPDLLMLDGGLGQVNAVKREMDAMGLDIPVFGMVKDDKHRTRALISAEGNEIGLTATPALFGFVGRIQEEVHRYAIAFHRAKRAKNSYVSSLDKIDGVGEKRRKALLKHFKTISAIKQADVEDLMRFVPYNVALELKGKL